MACKWLHSSIHIWRPNFYNLWHRIIIVHTINQWLSDINSVQELPMDCAFLSSWYWVNTSSGLLTSLWALTRHQAGRWPPATWTLCIDLLYCCYQSFLGDFKIMLVWPENDIKSHCSIWEYKLVIILNLRDKNCEYFNSN